MASLTAISGKMVFKTDSGEVKNGKAVYRNVTIGGVDCKKPASAISDAAKAVKGLIAFSTEQITLVRTDLLAL